MTTPPDPPPADSASPSRGVPGEVRITDPRTLRALAHPARLAILRHLALDGPATATECATVAGLSPSACSYHLRALAEYGLVEEAAGSSADGRQRPWRATVTSITIEDDASSGPGMGIAARALADMAQSDTDQLRARFLDQHAQYPPEWRSALGMVQDVVHVTPAELRALRDQWIELTGKYRRLLPEERPPGTRRVYVQHDLLPWFPPDDD